MSPHGEPKWRMSTTMEWVPARRMILSLRTSMRTDGTTIELVGNKEVPLSMVGDKSSKSSLKRTRAERKSEKVPQKVKPSHKMKTTLPSIKHRQPWMTGNVVQD